MLSIGFTAVTVQLNRKQLNFSAIISCTKRFQEIIGQLKSADPALKAGTVKRYVDLCNEELFYFKHKYLPDEIIDEWLEGMIYYLPHITKNSQNVNEEPTCLREIHDEGLLDDYPRLKDTFTVSRAYNLGEKSDRDALISGIKQRLEMQEKNKGFWSRVRT